MKTLRSPLTLYSPTARALPMPWAMAPTATPSPRASATKVAAKQPRRRSTQCHSRPRHAEVVRMTERMTHCFNCMTLLSSFEPTTRRQPSGERALNGLLTGSDRGPTPRRDRTSRHERDRIAAKSKEVRGATRSRVQLQDQESAKRQSTLSGEGFVEFPRRARYPSSIRAGVCERVASVARRERPLVPASSSTRTCVCMPSPSDSRRPRRADERRR